MRTGVFAGLKVVLRRSCVLVTTDRAVAHIVAHGDAYASQELPVQEDADEGIEVLGSGLIDSPGRMRLAVAYADVANEKFYLQVSPFPQPLSTNAGEDCATKPPEAVRADGKQRQDSIRFELVSAPTDFLSIHAEATNGDIFHGVILFRTDSMVGFGFVDERGHTSPSKQCIRLSNTQFATFFPEFADFTHPVISSFLTYGPENEGLITFGCADVYIRVFQGSVKNKLFGGPYITSDFQMDGPVTSVTLFTERILSGAKSSWNLLATCAIGYALVFSDLFKSPPTAPELLPESDMFDSVFAGLAVDVDLDGKAELLLGTDQGSLVVYKNVGTRDGRSSWRLQPKKRSDFEAFGSVYCLRKRDVNNDGIDELLLATSTGVFVLEMDQNILYTKMERILGLANPKAP
ncbi:TPA: hypothetical protein N0F65_012648 [Lagenidium giganteum]|uniref:Kaptin n=1 Tax=Lagenidium giganteum TaxID=4803 RepID=A0AAV2YM53_9STRA|nr:TPA: hypothetical protein N0F65_012648 [Lagenidium giganteum]